MEPSGSLDQVAYHEVGMLEVCGVTCLPRWSMYVGG